MVTISLGVLFRCSWVLGVGFLTEIVTQARIITQSDLATSLQVFRVYPSEISQPSSQQVQRVS